MKAACFCQRICFYRPRFTRGVVGVAAALVLGMLLAGCSPVTLVVGVGPGDRRLTETVVQDDGRWNSPKVAVIDVSGLIAQRASAGLLSPPVRPVADFVEALDKAGRDRRVAAVIVRINSPGGTVTASEMMYRELQRFRDTTGKPVVVLMMDVAASGGYYLACAADRIVAHPTTVTGSIGVIVQLVSLQPALSNLGITAEALTSGENKDAGSPLGTLSDEERATLRRLVTDFYGQFVAVVTAARPGLRDEHRDEALDGRVLSGSDAHAWGLVDAVGDVYTAVALACELAGVTHADVVRYHRPLDDVGSIYATSPVPPVMSGPGGGNLMQLNVNAGMSGGNLQGAGVDASSGFYYLWSPGR